jgi:hypothetical protein
MDEGVRTRCIKVVDYCSNLTISIELWLCSLLRTKLKWGGGRILSSKVKNRVNQIHTLQGKEQPILQVKI